MKTCTKCGDEYPATTEYFYRHKEGKNGLRPDCKMCCKKHHKEYCHQHREKINEYQKEYYQQYLNKMREAGCQRSKKCYRTEKGKERLRHYRQTEKGKSVCQKAEKKYYNTIKGYLERVFKNIKRRCDNPGCQSYGDYGGRGIKCLFKSLDTFRDYVVDDLQVDPRGLDIDRINNNGHYEPGNIRFVTHKKNCNNRRK